MYYSYKISALLLCFILSISDLCGQQTTGIIKTEKAATVVAAEITTDFAPKIIHLRKPNVTYNTQQQLPRTKQLAYPIEQQPLRSATAEVQAPVKVNGFDAIANDNGYPNDNDLAISNDGIVISVVNSQIHFYDTTGVLLQKFSLDAFFDTLGLAGETFDPRIVYDEAANRFICVFLSGYYAADSYVILAFSATDNPLDAWNFYKIPGNALGDTTWSDFPIVAISENEVFINVSNYDDNAGFFTYNYYGTRVIQANKADGYAGDSLTFVYHYNFPFENDLPWVNDYMQLTPVQGGSQPYGPNMYLLGVYDTRQQSDTVFLVEITDVIGSSSTITKTLKADLPYTQVEEAQQPGNHKLLTNYNTICNGYYENGSIHFVKTNPDTGGRAAIYHGIITDVGGANTIHAEVIANDTLELAFPNIIYAGEYQNDGMAVIMCNHSSNDHYPGNSVLAYNNGKYSEITLLREGQNVMDFSNDVAERWGDYTGGQLKYNEQGKIWVAGSYGANTWYSETHISCIDVSGQLTSIPNKGKQVLSTATIRTYPNPSSELVTVDFEAAETDKYRFELYDNKGQLIKIMLEGRAKAGLNRFQMNVADLPPGTYFLKGYNQNSEVLQHTIVVE